MWVLFANKFVNKDNCYDENNISMENYKKAGLYWLSGEDGIIGRTYSSPKFQNLWIWY